MSKNSHRKHEQTNKRKGQNSKPVQAYPTPVLFRSIFEKYQNCIYLIVRLRPKPEAANEFTVQTLGTGFLASPSRMMTAAHVLNDTITPNAGEMSKHKDGDRYLFLRHGETNEAHIHTESYSLNSDLFLYQESDLGIIHLKDSFYTPGIAKGLFLKVSDQFAGIANPVGVIGYPITHLGFDPQSGQPRAENVFIRTDQGIVNTRYTLDGNDGKQLSFYEFTIAFNSGNSGGPIIDLVSSEVVAWVHGYKRIGVNIEEVDLPEYFKPARYKEASYIQAIQATYSLGIATACVADELRANDIIT